MTTTIVTRTNVSNEYVEGVDYGVIELTKELAQEVLSRRKTFLAAKASDKSLAYTKYWCSAVEYHSGEDALHDLFGERTHVAAPYEEFIVTNKDLKLDESESTCCGMMVMDEGGVHWTCYPKHVENCTVETMQIPYSVFEGAL